MTGRHAGPPLGSAAREATASPYAGRRRDDDAYLDRCCLRCKEPVSADAGFFELTRQPSGERFTLCSMDCLTAFVRGVP